MIILRNVYIWLVQLKLLVACLCFLSLQHSPQAALNHRYMVYNQEKGLGQSIKYGSWWINTALLLPTAETTLRNV